MKHFISLVILTGLGLSLSGQSERPGKAQCFADAGG